ncbi:S4A5 protein, partial [Amia calva]|nr:S4A5 protein [Amia calva]
MDTLQHDGEELEWKESARWVKFEEKVEEGGERWSKPHVSTLSLHSLFELRTCLQTGTILLDLDGYSLPQIVDDIIERQVEEGMIDPELRDKISFVLLRKHRHQTKKPIHRSLADIGKSVSSTNRSPSRSPAAGAGFHRSTEDLRSRQAGTGNYGRLRHAQSRSMNDIADTPSTDQSGQGAWRRRPEHHAGDHCLTPRACSSRVGGAANVFFGFRTFNDTLGLIQKLLHPVQCGVTACQSPTHWAQAPRQANTNLKAIRNRMHLVCFAVLHQQNKLPLGSGLRSSGVTCVIYVACGVRPPHLAPALFEYILTRTACPAENLLFVKLSNPSTLKNKFMKKIPRDAEASNVLVGEVDFLDKPFVAFVRLAQATTLGGLTEVPVPTRFLFVLLGPHGKAKSYNEIGRAIATLMVDDLFSDVAYKARDREDLIAGIDEFLDEVIVLPPGEWDPTIRIEPPKKLPSAEKRKSVFSVNEAGQMNGTAGGGGGGSDDEEMPVPHELGEELMWTGRFCGGLFLDMKRKLPWFPSDFFDGFHIQSISAILFIYLGCITNAITFGGLLGDATDNYQGVMESFLGTALSGTVFCVFSGQPLIILSSTGPILIFEKLLYDFSKGNDIDYMEFRLWIGLHSCLQCLVLVATDASFIIKYITRFTEEGFSMLISLIFIYDAIKKMIGAFKYYPINTDFKPDYVTAYKCECVAPDPGSILIRTNVDLLTPEEALMAPNNTNISVYNPVNVTALDWSQLSKKECLKYGGTLVGKTCKYVPDLALMSFILFFGTYSMTVTLKKFKFSRYFPTKLRKLISDFSIFMSIMTFVGLDMLMGLNTPKLIVPTEFKPTRPGRGWIVMPFGKNPWWVYLASFLPALLVTILIFMDQQISAVIVNRKEHKLKKGAGYHLDLFWVGVLMAICSFMGLPWYVAATVISIAHIDSLKMETESSAPGEQPQFLGVREQRLTGIMVFILTGVSIFMAPILQYIPMPVLYGVFLYMGVASLNGIQFWDRCKLYLMPAKHQPDYAYLRHVPLRKVHLFTVVQVVCLTVLWVLKSTVAAIIFPVMILALIVVRKMLDLVFSQHDLAWLDDILPEKDKKKADDKKKKKKSRGGGEDSDDEGKGHLHSNCSPSDSDLDRSITLHLKISCPSSPAVSLSRNAACSVPQVKIEMESDYDDTDTDRRHRDMGSETTL